MDTTRFDRITALARRALAGAALAALLAGVGAHALPAAPAAAQPAPVDSDGDGLYDEDEQYIYGTDAFAYDTDGDGSSDGEEVFYGTDPLAADAGGGARADGDGDGLYDQDETAVYGTDPTLFDTDGDGAGDGEEVFNGTDPRSGLDGGGAGGAAGECGAYCGEYEPGETTCWACLAAADSDGDLLSDLDEAAAGTDPTRGDTDGDGHGDATEVLGCKGGFPSNPLDPASWPVCGLN